MCRTQRVLSGVLVVILLWTSILARPQTTEKDERLFKDILSVFEKTLEFFARDYSSVNLDGLYGLRIGQGNVVSTVTDCSKRNFRCPVEVTSRLETLVDKINTIAERAMPYVQSVDEEYFESFLPTIEGPFLLKFTPVWLGNNVKPPGTNHKYNEDAGDRCFSLLIGTAKAPDGTPLPQCTLTDDCWHMMTQRNMAGYAITHQLLYFIMAEKTNCLAELERRMLSLNVSGVHQFQGQLCGSVISEVKRETASGRVDPIKQDLFLEQSLLCGSLGFQDFFHPAWMRMVLGWQSHEGCFSSPSNLVDMENFFSNLREERTKVMDLLVKEAQHIKNNHHRPAPSNWMPTSRKLMREKVMKGDCLAHKTGLAFGTLGVYIRDMVNKLYS